MIRSGLVGICLSLSLWLVACGRPVTQPLSPLKPPPHYLSAPRSSSLTPPPDNWWQDFTDPALDELVARVLKHNYDLRQAVARVAEMKAQSRVARAARFPRLDFNFQGRRERNVIFGPFFTRSPSYIIGRFNSSLAASYEVDLWRRLSKESQAAYLRLLQAEEDRQALAQTLVAEAVSTYLKRAFSLCQLSVLEEEIDLESRLLAILRERFSQGVVDLATVKVQESLLAQKKADRLVLLKELKSLGQKLDLLAGVYPGSGPRRASSLCELNLSPPPAGLPSELLLRRPDIRSARAALAAARAQAAAARAARFPSIKLTADMGRISTALKDLLRPENRWWQLAVSLSQPLFDAGALKAQEMAARARAESAEATYMKTVLQAFYEVESALLAEEKLAQILDQRLRQQEAIKIQWELKGRRYQAGVLEATALLEARRRYLETTRAVYEARQALFLNRVSLYRALGGSWPNLDRKTR